MYLSKPTLFSSIVLAFMFPLLDVFTQDMLGLRTYTLTSVWIWVVCALIVFRKYPVIAMSLFAFYARNLSFPFELLWILGRKTYDQSIACPVRACFNRFFRLHDNLDLLQSRPPQILLGNYPNDRFESFLVFMMPVRFVFVIKKSSWYSRRLQIHTRAPCIYVEDKKSYARAKEEINDYLGRGYFVFAYINNPSSIHPRHYARYRTGMIRIAQEIGIPISPIAFDQIETDSTGRMSDQSLCAHIGESRYVTHVQYTKQDLKQFFQKQTRRFQRLKKL
jgi:hypothetical protein